jgi:tetratricopeptide (TPR) repeat protein
VPPKTCGTEFAVPGRHDESTKRLEMLESRLLIIAVAAFAPVLLLQAGAQAQKAGAGVAEIEEANQINARAVELYGQGRYDTAEPLFLRALRIREKTLGPQHLDVATNLNALGRLCKDKGEYVRAEPLFERALRIREKVLGPDHPDVATCLNNLAVLYDAKGEYARAEPLFERALRIREKVLGPDHPDVATSLHDLSGLYYAKGDFLRTEPLLMRALRIREKALGPDHPDVATCLNDLATLYKAKGEYARAEPLYERALRIRERALGPEHPDLARSLNNLAGLYKAKGDYARAEPLFAKALSIREKALGPDNPDVAQSLSNLAGLHASKGEYARAEPLFVGALRIREQVLGRDHPDVATSLNNLANLFQDKGEYARAEPLYVRALRIREKALGKDHPDVATSLNNLANLYKAKGDYARAEPLLVRALGIREKALGPDHPAVAQSLSSLAMLYQDKRDYVSAEPLFERALRIRERALGPEHPSVAASLSNLALLRKSKGDFTPAEPLYVRALGIAEKRVGLESLDAAVCLNNLSDLYYARGDYARAEPLLVRSWRIREKALGPEHPNVAQSLNNLAAFYRATGDYTRAIETKRRADDVTEHNLAAILATGAEEQKQAYFATLSQDTNSTVSLHMRAALTLPGAAEMSLTTILRRKGRVLEAMRDLFRVLRQHADPKDLARIDELARVRAELAKRTLGGPAKGEDLEAHLRGLTELHEAGRQIEETLASRYAALGLKQIPVTLEAVQAALPSGAALVEYFAFKPIDVPAKPEGYWGELRYVAYVLRPRGEPDWVDLGETEPIDRLARQVRSKYATADPEAARAARDLDKLVMEPVRKLLGRTTDVFLSPDGELNLVPFGALLDENGEYLVKRYRLTYLSSGRDLLRLALRADAREGATIVAAPDYGDPGKYPGATKENGNRGERSVDMGSIRFSPLPGTLVEASRLAGILDNARLLTGAQATEGALKAMRAPRLLHLATHGFFLADLPAPPLDESQRGISHIGPVDDLPRPQVAMPENPLLRSGLALAGANRRASGQDDGILTAMEAMSLDLMGTQLVVLSACETGMGDVRTGDGVYGLRRALVLAGAETQIMTLWRIDDDATQRLMAEYYEKIAKGMGRSDAMRNVTLDMLANSRTANPKYWASFIVSGDPGPLHKVIPAARSPTP